MKENLLILKSKEFALRIIALCRETKNQGSLTNQLLRSATSIGANIHEANYAQSKPDFVSKLQIALKECYETEYWLDLLISANIINKENQNLLDACIEIKKILIKSCKKARIFQIKRYKIRKSVV